MISVRGCKRATRGNCTRRSRVGPGAKVGSRNRDALHAGKNFVEELSMSGLVEH
jgi:hypothetical protein